jgi:hypothetical protein
LPGRWRVRFVLSLLLTAVACSDAYTQVDRGLVGTWELMVPNPEGVARWVWEVHGDGTYAFHAEGPGGVPAHSGQFHARDGRYTLKSTTIVWVDSGTYQQTHADTLRATGILGTASWTRVKPPSARSRDILAYLTTRPLVSGMLEAPFGNPRTERATVDAQSQNDGVIGIVRTVVQSPEGAGAISLRIYRDWSRAQAAYTMDASYDAPSFRISPGQEVYSLTYTRSENQGKCLSRTQSNVSTATVTCYLLVEKPAREAVIVVSEFSEKRTASGAKASDAAYERAAGLLTAGIRYWELSLIGMKLNGISP